MIGGDMLPNKKCNFFQTSDRPVFKHQLAIAVAVILILSLAVHTFLVVYTMPPNNIFNMFSIFPEVVYTIYLYTYMYEHDTYHILPKMTILFQMSRFTEKLEFQ